MVPSCTSPPAVRDEDTCHVVVVAGSTYRYALQRSGTTQATIVVDPGGPGMSALARDGVRAVAAAYLGGLAASHNVLVVEEPWVTAPDDEPCRDAAAAFHGSFQADAAARTTAAATVRERCGLATPGRYGFAAHRYAELLREIARRERLTFTGFVGASFGAARLDYALSGGVRFQWATLVRPFPVRATLRQLHDARAAAVDASYPAVAIPRPAADTAPTSADVVAARTAAGQSGVAPRTAADITDRARRFWQSFGTDTISLSLLAYWDEICRRGADDAAAWDGSTDDTRGFLASFHAPCAGLASAQPTADVTQSTWPRLCIVNGRYDTVTPPRVVAASYRATAHHWVESADRAHTSTDGLDRCLTAVTKR